MSRRPHPIQMAREIVPRYERFERRDPSEERTLVLARALLARDQQLRELREAVERITQQQPETLAAIQSNGFVFDSIGREPGNWQHLAFTIYTDLCEVDRLARAALAASDPDSSPCGHDGR